MRLKVIACKVLFREIALIAATSPHTIDLTCLQQGLHNTPTVLKDTLQAEIDRIDANQDMHSFSTFEGQDFDAILLGYGLCSNGIMGISSKKYKIVVPRAHDCISLFLGSKERYSELFHSRKGIYWYNRSWIENSLMPGKERYEHTKKDFVDKYGDDNGEYLMEMEWNSLRDYDSCTFIDWPEFDNSHAKDFSKECAAYMGWKYEEVMGNSSLVHDFLDGNWDDERFQIIQPNRAIMPSYDNKIVTES